MKLTEIITSENFDAIALIAGITLFAIVCAILIVQGSKWIEKKLYPYDEDENIK